MADNMVDALLEERAGYVRRGRRDRVAQVDAVLAGYGVAVDDGPDGAPLDERVAEVLAAVVTGHPVAKRRGRPRKAG